MISNVVFDLGGVVLDWNPDAILKGYYADEESRALIKRELYQHGDWLDFDRGTCSEAELLTRLAARVKRSEAELSGLFEATRASLSAKGDTVALMGRLHRRRLRLYCLSNMAAATYEYLRARHSFWEVFRGVVISGEVKMMKPERLIFEHLLRTHGLVARDTVFIDDNLPNVEAARALGMKGVWFKHAAQCEQELEAMFE